MDDILRQHNAMVRKWAAEQPARYRLTAKAFGYRCDAQTHSFAGTVEWISRKSRERKGEGISQAKIKRDLKVFEAAGVITRERRRNGERNAPSLYHVDFGKVIPETDIEADYLIGYLEWLRENEAGDATADTVESGQRAAPRTVGNRECNDSSHVGDVVVFGDGKTLGCGKCGRTWTHTAGPAV
jgi:hypothetical protein